MELRWRVVCALVLRVRRLSDCIDKAPEGEHQREPSPGERTAGAFVIQITPQMRVLVAVEPVDLRRYTHEHHYADYAAARSAFDRYRLR